MSKRTIVWYACYGSNLREERFMCYLKGGSPDGATEGNPGALNSNSPPDIRVSTTKWKLHFAKASQKWGDGGVAFINKPDVEAGPETKCRLYQITLEQFIDVFMQENGGNPKDESDCREKLIKQTEMKLRKAEPDSCFTIEPGLMPNGWYRRIVLLGTRNSEPVLSFTSAEPLEFNQPSDAYLSVIAIGLNQAFPRITQKQIQDYLSETSHIEPVHVSKVANQAFEAFKSECRKNYADQRENAQFKFEGKVKQFAEPFRLIPTQNRENTQREFIIHLPEARFKGREGIRDRELIAVAAWHLRREFRVLATALPFPDSDNRKRALLDHEVALDQKIRTAIGVRPGDWIGLYRLNKRRRSSFIYWSLERLVGTQPQIMRVYLATFEDMEADVARMPQSTFELIGAEPGSTIAISSTTSRAHARGLVIADNALTERRSQFENEPDRYPDPVKDLRLHRLRSGSEGADLPPIFIDNDLRSRLGVRPNDPVRVVRDGHDVFFSRIYLILFPNSLGFGERCLVV